MGALSGSVAIVTGGSRGIGKSIAGALASEGAHVVLAARSQSDLDVCVQGLRDRGLSASAVRTDVTAPADAKELVSSTLGGYGRIDILVNNAGIGIFKSALDLQVEEFDRMWNVNMRGVFLVTKAVLPAMMNARHGTIINIASLAGKNAFKGGTGYGATKWALRGFAGSLMLEVREFDIRVVTIFPGSVDTSFSPNGKRGENIPRPDDVAAAVVFAATAPERAMFSEIDLRPTNPSK
jgi:3-oxoacyl-[acyl-carrier protein] reductase